MRRRRRRRYGGWKVTPFVWMAFVLNTIAGLMFSRVTSAVHARIEGQVGADHVAIGSAVTALANQPCLRADVVGVVSEILKNPAIQSVDIRRSIFGSARVKITYRPLVARYWTSPHIAVASNGSMFVTTQNLDRLPVLKLAPDDVRVGLGLVTAWDSGKYAQLCADARKSWPDHDLAVEVVEDKGVCLNIDSGRVVLGSLDELDKKLDVLRERLKRNPHELEDVGELILTQPNFPKIRRKAGDINY